MPAATPHDVLVEIVRRYHLAPPPRPFQYELAAEFGMHPQTIHAIVNGTRADGLPHHAARDAMASLGLAVVKGQVVYQPRGDAA